MARDQIATAVQDFIILPLHLPPQKSYPKEATHYIYVRPNAPRVPTEDTLRELFLVNVPVDATEAYFRSLFADQLGGARVEEVEFEDARVGKGIKAPVTAPSSKRGKKRKRAPEVAEEDAKEVGLLPETWDRELHRSGGTAVLRFVDRASAEMALREVRRAVKNGRKIMWEVKNSDTVPPLGSARYASHHRLRYPDPAVLQASVDGFMAAYAAQEAERSRNLARQRTEPDEDGFVTVTRGGRNAPAREAQTKAVEEELKRREKDRVKDDFYRFQVREKKKEQALDLVKGFEEDRRKVDAMRQRERLGQGGRRPNVT